MIRRLAKFALITFLLSACYTFSEQEKYSEAHNYLLNNDPLAAIVVCNEGIARLKEADSLYFYRAIGYGWIKKFENGIIDWKTFLEKYPECDTCRLALGSLLIKSGDTAAALNELGKVVFASNTLSAQAIIERAMLYFHQSKWGKCLDELHFARKKAGDYFLPYYYIGYFYSQYAGADSTLPIEQRVYPCLNTDSALFYFDRSIYLNARFADNYYRKGLVYENLFQLDSARFNYEKALKLDSVRTYKEQLDRLNKKLKNRSN